jgi:cytoskeletal protein CcmA (bactofilin family)
LTFWRRGGQSRIRPGDLTAFVDEGSEIEGTYTFRGTVMLNGKFKGEIQSSDTLIVGDKGVVDATIHAGTVVVSGEVVGTVTATARLEIKRGGRLLGDVDAPVIVIEEGAVLEGHCRMTRSPSAESPAPGRDLSIVSARR